MSATNRGGKRSPADFYPTPLWATRLFLRQHALPMRGRWLEPSAGDGAIVRVVNAHQAERGGPPIEWTLVEKHHGDRAFLTDFGEVHTNDFLAWADARTEERAPGSPRLFDVCIANPPFSLAAEFLQRACALADHVAFLLRVGFLSAEKRAPLWAALGVPDQHVHGQRLSFNGRGGDSSDYAWFVLHPDRPRTRGALHLLPLVPLDARRVPKLALEVPMQASLELEVA